MAISGDTYKQIGRSAAGAVSVVAAYDHTTNAVVGLTVSSFSTLSFEPPLVMFTIQHNASSYPAMVASKSFGVSLLSVQQVEVAQRFATKGPDKARGVTVDHGTTLPVPLVPGALAQIECQTHEILMSGDHAIIIGLVQAATTHAGEPLLYFARQFGSFIPLPGA